MTSINQRHYDYVNFCDIIKYLARFIVDGVGLRYNDLINGSINSVPGRDYISINVNMKLSTSNITLYSLDSYYKQLHNNLYNTGAYMFFLLPSILISSNITLTLCANSIKSFDTLVVFSNIKKVYVNRFYLLGYYLLNS